MNSQNSSDSFWQHGSLSLRYPLTPILEDEYFGSDDCDAQECDETIEYHNDADDEEEEEIVTLTTKNSRHLYSVENDLLFESEGSAELFESLESKDNVLCR